jgi:hypothetical protein
MATNDLRRSDLRTNVRINSFWLKSAEINKDVTGDLNVLFGFSAVAGQYFIHEVVVEIETLFAGGTPALDIGYCTLDDPSVDLSVSSSDVDNYIAKTEITEGTAGWYPGGAWAVDTAGAVTGTDWAKAKIEGTIGELVITGADTVMPCITATVAASMTAGAARVYVLVSRIQ